MSPKGWVCVAIRKTYLRYPYHVLSSSPSLVTTPKLDVSTYLSYDFLHNHNRYNILNFQVHLLIIGLQFDIRVSKSKNMLGSFSPSYTSSRDDRNICVSEFRTDWGAGGEGKLWNVKNTHARGAA